MDNKGKANVRVRLMNHLPNITKNTQKYNFDISADVWNVLQKSEFLSPFLCEYITDPANSFSAIYPAKRINYIDNFMVDYQGDSSVDSDSGSPYILWNAIGGVNNDGPIGVKGDIRRIISDGNYDEYTLLQPGQYIGEYFGPEWNDELVNKRASTSENDIAAYRQKLIDLGLIEDNDEGEDEGEDEENEEPLASTNWVFQSVVKDGLWWGIESSEFLNENMPFWVMIRKAESPSSNNYPTFIAISLGIDSDEHAYDLILKENAKPLLVDYFRGRDSDTLPNAMEFDQELSRIFDTEGHLFIGFMTVAGRLIIFVNKLTLVYTRVLRSIESDSSANEEEPDSDEVAKLLEAKIKGKKIKIYGSNIQCSINVSPMTFAPYSILSLPVKTPDVAVEDSGLAGPGETGAFITLEDEDSTVYKNVKNNGEIGVDPVCVLPSPPDYPGKIYGVDCKKFLGIVGNVNPSGFGFHKKGFIKYDSATNLGIANDNSSDYNLMFMRPSSLYITTPSGSKELKYAGAPYFFRLKGGIIQPPTIPLQSYKDISEDVISVTQNSNAPDYFHIKNDANIVLYNKGGKYDELKYNQFGIEISFGWEDDDILSSDDYKLTFTGMTVSANTSEKSGMEVVNVNCQDYMFILENMPIINSPFYDGMVMYYAIKDIAERGGVTEVINDWENDQDYFLPTGYAFTDPAMRFGAVQKLLECATNIVKRAEAFIYFDEFGRFHIKNLPGGLFSVGANELIRATFTRNPQGPNTIIGEKNIENDLSSTVNRISIFTLNRDSRNAIVYSKPAEGNQDILLYRRIHLEDQAALGSYEVAVDRAEELGKRIFFPIRKTSFRVIGSDTMVYPLDFVDVDGQEFRILGITRKYDATDNTYEIDYNAEWLGGGIPGGLIELDEDTDLDTGEEELDTGD